MHLAQDVGGCFMDTEQFNATKYKNDFAKQNYDRANITFPKGKKALIEEYRKAQGYKSLNAYINVLIDNDMKSEKEKNINVGDINQNGDGNSINIG